MGSLKMVSLRPIVVLVLANALGGCRVVSGIFKAGYVVGIVAAVLAVGAVALVMSVLRRRAG